MHIKVSLEPHGDGDGPRYTFLLNCGNGEQILRWVGCVACGRLAIDRGDVMGQYVPQAVLAEDGKILDIDTILNEAFQEGDAVKVAYSNGPKAFTARWEGRPKTPPFKWGINGEELPPFDAWLTEMDLTVEPLITPLLPSLLLMEANYDAPYNAAEDCEALHRLLKDKAGALQAAFHYTQSSMQKQNDVLGRLVLTQFRAFVQGVLPEFASEKIDEIFTTTALSEKALERKHQTQSSCFLDLEDFFLALVQISAQWSTNSTTSVNGKNESTILQSLTQKFTTFWVDCYSKGIMAELRAKVEKIKGAYTNQVDEILRKNRRLTEQTLESCQKKRIRCSEISVEFQHLCQYFTRWGLLGREFSMQDLSLMAIAAKQETANIEDFELHPEPMSLNFDDFERLLFAISWHMGVMQKKKEQFVSFLADTLEDVYKKAGVLIEIQKS